MTVIRKMWINTNDDKFLAITFFDILFQKWVGKAFIQVCDGWMSYIRLLKTDI